MVEDEKLDVQFSSSFFVQTRLDHSPIVVSGKSR
jgi:hypothetical protein